MGDEGWQKADGNAAVQKIKNVITVLYFNMFVF